MQNSAAAVGTRRGPQARGRATRESVLKAAEELFTRFGYERASMGDIARRAGLGVGTIYHHFADKRAILLELIDSMGERLASHRRTDLDFAAFLGQSPAVAIETWLAKTYARLQARPSIYLVVLSLVGCDDEVRRRYQRVEQIAVEWLRALIEFGQRRGFMRQTLDPEAAAFLIQHCLDMAVAQLLLRQPSGPESERVFTQLVDLIRRFILEDTYEHQS